MGRPDRSTRLLHLPGRLLVNAPTQEIVIHQRIVDGIEFDLALVDEFMQLVLVERLQVGARHYVHQAVDLVQHFFEIGQLQYALLQLLRAEINRARKLFRLE